MNDALNPTTDGESANSNDTDSGTDSGCGSGNEDGPEVMDALNPAADGEYTNHDDLAFNGPNNRLTLDGEPIMAKAQVFRIIQSHTKEKSGLHVWNPVQLRGDLTPEDIPSIEEPTEEFIAQHENRYKGIHWIAMSVDNAIIQGARQYSRITVMVEWLGELEDTLMWRSDLIRIVDKASKARVNQDLQNHLPYRETIECEGRRVLITSQTEAGLLKGKNKALQRIKDDRFEAAQVTQTAVDKPPFHQPSANQPAAGQSVVPQAGATQPSVAQAGAIQPAIPQAGVTQPAITQAGHPSRTPKQESLRQFGRMRFYPPQYKQS